MSISVTVSGEDSTSVVSAQALSDTVTVSGISAVQVTTTSGDAATVTVSTGDPVTITGNYSNYITGDVVRPNEISDFLTSAQISSNINSAIDSLVDSAPGALDTLNELAAALNDDENFGSDTVVSISNLNSATGELSTATGLLVQKSETGVFYTNDNPSGFITGVDLSDLQTATGNLDTRVSLNSSNISIVSGLITSNDGDISALQTATGLLVQKSETGSFVTDSDTGAFYAKSNPSGFITGVDLSQLETATGNLDSRVTSNDGEISALQTATGLLVQKSETGIFVTTSDTGSFYAASNPSGFITGVDLSSYVQDSETGLFLVSGQDATVGALDVTENVEVDGILKIGSTPVYSPTRSIKLHDDGVQYGGRVSLIGTTDNGFPGLEMVTDGNLSKRTLIRHEGEGSNDYGISFYTTDAGSVSESVRFAGDGNVGIGTSSPSQKLEVNGSILIPNAGNGGAFKAKDSNGDARNFYRLNADNTQELGGGNAAVSDTIINAGGAASAVVIKETNGNVGIGTSSPSAKLHSNGTNDTDYLALFTSNGATPNLSQSDDTKRRAIAVQGEGAAYYIGRDLTNNIEFAMGTSIAGVVFLGSLTNHGVDIRVNNQNALKINTAKDVTVVGGHLNVDSDSKYLKLGASQDAGIIYDGTNMVFDSQLVGAGDFVFENGNFGIGTTSPSAKLDVSGDANIDGTLTLIDQTIGGSKTITADNNNLTFSSVHGIFGYSIGLRGNRGSTLGMESAGSILDISAPSDITLTPGGDTEIQSDLTVAGNALVSGDLTVSGNSSFANRPTVNGTGVLLSGEGGGGTVENVVYTTGDQTISGIKSFDKITLSENSFVTETGDFSIGATHRGATVLLQNSSAITVTIPAQVSGHTTTFIAETSNSVLFATGSGISGLNSFGGANQIAGIFGHAQVIFKSPEYAFLGGNIS